MGINAGELVSGNDNVSMRNLADRYSEGLEGLKMETSGLFGPSEREQGGECVSESEVWPEGKRGRG